MFKHRYFCIFFCSSFLPMDLKLWNWQLNKYSFRWFQHAGESFVKVPFFGAISYLTLAVCPFCIAFSVIWAVFRRISFAWIGQDILVREIFHNLPLQLILVYFILYNIPAFSANIILAPEPLAPPYSCAIWFCNSLQDQFGFSQCLNHPCNVFRNTFPTRTIPYFIKYDIYQFYFS